MEVVDDDLNGWYVAYGLLPDYIPFGKYVSHYYYGAHKYILFCHEPLLKVRMN